MEDGQLLIVKKRIPQCFNDYGCHKLDDSIEKEMRNAIREKYGTEREREATE